MKILILNSVILAYGEFQESDAEFVLPLADGSEQHWQKTLGAMQLVDTDVPTGFTPQAYELINGELALKAPVVIPPAVPESVSPRQIRQALTRSGQRSAVEAAVAASDQDTKDWWEFATEFRRDNSHLNVMAQTMELTAEQVDAVFVLAVSL